LATPALSKNTAKRVALAKEAVPENVPESMIVEGTNPPVGRPCHAVHTVDPGLVVASK
jgi:hypothetical protein